MKINKIIIWGHKLHSHTHSYIHSGYYEAFKKLGYPTYWFDNSDDVSNFDFSNSLFITEHQVSEKIPLKDDCLYFSHFISSNKFDNLPKDNVIELKCSYRDFHDDLAKNIVINNLENHCFYSKGPKFKIFYTIWATDLFPEEIQNNINHLEEISKLRNEKKLNFVGSIYYNLENILFWANKNNIEYCRKGASFDINSIYNCSKEENQNLIQNSVIAPAFVVHEHLEKNYVNCRTFKNISYGRMPLTNSAFINKIFDNKLIFDEDIQKCCDKGLEFEKRDDKLIIIKELMEIVRDNHTYISRVKSLCNYVNKFTSFEI